ncbi:FAD-dependent oxidoreductase [Streptomyces huiliensis]|uniref:FAD-dependent oxidoreductase n=1 Tax=Streptomyces huiliensis TaxID=2876027 RepID=UPI001CBB8A3E|nr:FAD-dependent oxidoreductase [Streptomyces huiliensis]MBZ4321388.1 FAD-dependent oxidoreductase [Streptomyces huiliensis]
MSRTTCAIAGAGPAGMMLGMLLARAGVETVVLEKHADFLRDFRGDTVHASTHRLMGELGLGERFRKLPHHRIHRLQVVTDDGPFTLADFRRLPGQFPYITFLPQWDFLDFLVEEADRFPNFRLLRESEVTGILRSGNRVTGVRYRDKEGREHELRADLTVAADGRRSAVRAASGLRHRAFGSGMDILWFRLSKRDDDPGGMVGRLSADGKLLVRIERQGHWQAALAVRKGGYEQLRAEGLEAFRESLAELKPFLADRVHEVRTWDDVKVLDVQIDRLQRWWRPGLLCIGDAAHTMSPIMGVGINLAVQDAVAAANILAEPLRDGTLEPAHLERVQRRRMPPTVVTQRIQRALQTGFLEPWINGQGKSTTPRVLRVLRRLPPLQGGPARAMAIGLRPEHPARELR